MRKQERIAIGLLLVAALRGQETPHTEITKWQDGKQACVSPTFDDSSINQFRIGIPLLNERGLPATFFIVTGNIPGSRYRASFVGRPMMDIIRESASVPTTKENLFERTSLLNHLRTAQRVEEIGEFNAQRLGRLIRDGKFDEAGRAVDGFMAKLHQSGATYAVRERERTRDRFTWDDFRRFAAQGHEFASHTVTHPYMTALDEANNVYEIEKSIEDIREQMGARHTFSIECPYGIHDERVRPFAESRVPLTRNWVSDDFMDGIMRGDSRDPKSSTREYVQWQRGPHADTPLETMKGWVDTSIEGGVWLVLVFHGIEGIGYEALPTETVRAYFDYIREREGRMWVATFQDGAKYARERMNSKVTARMAGDAIEVSVSHSLDPKLYDLPLTARTAIPADWKVVRFRQGDDVRWVPVHREGGKTFVIYRIAPNGSVARLEKG
ncbi:MAG: polysaccharide deacetylase family protein [Bryobacteraceae bacterium]